MSTLPEKRPMPESLSQMAYRIFMCRQDTREKAYTVASKEQNKRSHLIDAQLRKERDELDKFHKVLLLGGPSSGKSTIFKQMKILHLNGFTESDYVNYRYLIHANTMESVSQIIKGGLSVGVSLDETIEYEVQWFLTTFNSMDREITEKMTEVIRVICESDFYKKTLEHKDEFELLDSAEYFLANLDRICAHGYNPDKMDILRARVPTTGIIEIQFPFRGQTLKMVDVGGQRTEQRKWIHCFDNVAGILFVAELSSYNMKTEDESFKKNEDGTVVQLPPENKLKYTMRIFKRIANNKIFGADTALILFLNKVDIFREKLTRQNIDACFEEYKGKQTFEETTNYVKQKFDRLVRAEVRQAKSQYVHFTNATDTTNVDRVFNSCLDLVFKRNMESCGVKT